MFRQSYQLAMLATFVVVHTAAAQGQLIVDFEDADLWTEQNAAGNADNQEPYSEEGVSFNRGWLTEFECCPTGWAPSNQTNLTSPGPASAWSAYALPKGGGADGSSHYAVAFNSTRGSAQAVFPSAGAPNGMYVTNSTYPYLAITTGDDGPDGTFVKGSFGAGDWFKLDIIGVDLSGNDTGVVEFYLADFRNGQNLVISDWTWVDLTPLGDGVKTLEFEMSSTDSGQFGMSTPAYFAIDNLTIVPEPRSLPLLLGGCVWLFGRGSVNRALSWPVMAPTGVNSTAARQNRFFVKRLVCGRSR